MMGTQAIRQDTVQKANIVPALRGTSSSVERPRARQRQTDWLPWQCCAVHFEPPPTVRSSTACSRPARCSIERCIRCRCTWDVDAECKRVNCDWWGCTRSRQSPRLQTLTPCCR